ncbi:hypothetical protein QJS10_CPA03g00219 [Acorus calamus]|uniref:AUGMIN subunit 4 n=1 Tax=Acorus calamus TaxID=4465 RepID=A0AAV9FB45_ACOCL|nr:hypothetical protein QJS10_CPA03g00219 [Acorus calamus]
MKPPNVDPNVAHIIDLLERHSLSRDGSMASASSDLHSAREDMCRARLQFLETMEVYREAIAIVEEFQQTASSSAKLLGGARDRKSSSSSQVYEYLEHQIVVAEAAQRLRLPLLSKDGEIHEEDREKSSVKSRSSYDSMNTSFTVTSSSNSTNFASSLANAPDCSEAGVGGVPNCFLGLTPSFLSQVQLQQAPAVDMAEYQTALAHDIEVRLKAKCDKLAEILVMDGIDASSISQLSSVRLPERVKLIIEEIEREEAALQEDLYSADRKFGEYYGVLEQILGVLIKLVKDLKLQKRFQYDKLRKTWLCKRCKTMSAKLRVLEHLLLYNTYTQDTVPALHMIRKYLMESIEEASISYNKAVTRLREYQGVDPHFDTIAWQYHDIAKKLEGLQWTIHQVEMDLKRSLEQPIP